MRKTCPDAVFKTLNAPSLLNLDTLPFKLDDLGLVFSVFKKQVRECQIP